MVREPTYVSPDSCCGTLKMTLTPAQSASLSTDVSTSWPPDAWRPRAYQARSSSTVWTRGKSGGTLKRYSATLSPSSVNQTRTSRGCGSPSNLYPAVLKRIESSDGFAPAPPKPRLKIFNIYDSRLIWNDLSSQREDLQSDRKSTRLNSSH